MSGSKKFTAKLKDETPPPPLEPQQAKDRAVFIRDNIKIANGVFVGVGSVIVKDVIFDNVVVAGNPAKILRKRKDNE